MFYIVGLGNPGEKYSKTRHNVGRMIVESIGNSGGFSEWSKSKPANALYSHGSIAGDAVELVLPETFMNRSGETIQFVANKHHARPGDFIVVHDEIDLPFGELKISAGRGAGGNNGIESIINHLGSKDFVRVRVGIAPTSFLTGKVKRPSGGGPLERFVLKPFSKKEAKALEKLSKKVSGAIETILKDGPEAAMNQYH